MDVLVLSSAGLPHCRIVSNNSLFYSQRITLTLGHFPEYHYLSLQVEPDTTYHIKYVIYEENLVTRECRPYKIRNYTIDLIKYANTQFNGENLVLERQIIQPTECDRK